MFTQMFFLFWRVPVTISEAHRMKTNQVPSHFDFMLERTFIKIPCGAWGYIEIWPPSPSPLHTTISQHLFTSGGPMGYIILQIQFLC